ncbi:MAG TPA: sulfatase [Chondromyces sp.]|nr:sulfatase [Chondromyces sp.]
MRARGSLFRGLRAIATVLSAAAVAAGCGRPPVETRSRDLVTGHGLRTDGQVLRPQEVLAADETWVAVTLPGGRPANALLELASEPVLVLAGSLDCGGAPPAEGVFHGVVEPDLGRPIEFRFELAESAGWWRHEIELGRLGGRGAELRIEAEVPPECALRLREVSVLDRRPVAPQRDAGRVQLLLISVDTLRHDAVGVLTTPNLERLAAESESFDSCYAAASWTKPSHASMLTGFHPDTHRALLADHAIDPALPTLAARLQGGGLATGALVYDCTWLSPRWGFGKGFDSYQVTRWRAGQQAEAAAEWLFDHRDRDFFFFLHTFEPHSDFNVLPYEAPGLSRASIAARFGVQDFGCRDGICASQLLAALSRGQVPARSTDREILRASYDAGVRYLDASLGTLFERLRRGGLWDRLMVIVTSDHGEEFAEHGGYGHETLHEEVLRVPLIVKWPQGQRAGEVNEAPRSGIDLAPTLLHAAGLPLDDLPGTDLREKSPEAVIMAGTLERAVIADGLKGFFDGKGPDRLFDLAADPGETTDLAAARPDELRRLAGMLDAERRRALALYRRLGSSGEAGKVELSEAERERLRAFGYLQ